MEGRQAKMKPEGTETTSNNRMTLSSLLKSQAWHPWKKTNPSHVTRISVLGRTAVAHKGNYRVRANPNKNASGPSLPLYSAIIGNG